MRRISWVCPRCKAETEIEDPDWQKVLKSYSLHECWIDVDERGNLPEGKTVRLGKKSFDLLRKVALQSRLRFDGKKCL